MGSEYERARRKQRGEGHWRLVRYADDWVALVSRTREHAEALLQRAGDVLASLGLRLSERKTKITHLDEGIDFLGFRIQRRKKRGSEKRYTYTHPSATAQKAVRRKVRGLTNKSIPLAASGHVVEAVNRRLRGWCNYFQYAIAKRFFAKLE